MIKNSNILALKGDWRVLALQNQLSQLEPVTRMSGQAIELDLTGIEAMDSAGAWVLYRTRRQCLAQGQQLSFHVGNPDHQKLLDLVSRFDQRDKLLAPLESQSYMERIGRFVVENFSGAILFLSFWGQVLESLYLSIIHPSKWRWKSVVGVIQRAGYDAVPITGVLAFLIGVVVAYQGGVQLRNYGANLFVVDLIGLILLRELAPMIVAIVVAGRTSSSFTAEIATMSMNEELDALKSMGISSIQLLVLPKILALILVVPLLTVFADIVGVWGGAIVAQIALDLDFVTFWGRFEEAVSVQSFLIGLIKAPVFGAMIAILGCYHGIQVRGGAGSVGAKTTISVVQSIFWVIFFDGIVAFVLALMGI